MTRDAASIVLASALLPIALVVIGCTADLAPRTCTAGREVTCTCSGGGEGLQTCRADGSGFDACRCVDGGVGPRDGGLDGGTDVPVDVGAPMLDTGTPEPDAWTDPDTGPPPSCAWVWMDRGGPAFQATACRPGPGVVDGMLVEPRAFFESLVAGRDPNTWETVMNEIEGELWSCGVGQQRGSGGDVRGRLFLPTGACPDSSPPPDDMRAMFLGVRQLPECWDHPADVVECP